uniref:Unkown protein n=1 Tax=Riptortus pedestris TaxID=329032 RepID=R4WQX8_RIPPE|nr:unkown protein [Riptortus pedestris]
MKFILLLLALVGCVVADSAPYRPKGALLVLPQQFNPSAAQQVQQEEAETLDKVSEKVMERLRQEQGSQTGNYHVYLADGRLQKVQYTAAPLKSSSTQNDQSVNLQNSQAASSSNSYQFNQQNAQTSAKFQAYSQPQQYNQYREQQSANSYSRVPSQGTNKGQVSEPNPVVAHFGRLQQERLQQQLQQLQQQQEQLKQEAENVQQQLQQQQEFASNYVATVQFSDVPPIPAPIYSQGPAPITRILRQAL